MGSAIGGRPANTTVFGGYPGNTVVFAGWWSKLVQAILEEWFSRSIQYAKSLVGWPQPHTDGGRSAGG